MRIIHADAEGLLDRACAHDLARVGRLAVLMDAGRLTHSVDTALACLREDTGADACELFLADPKGLEVFLVAHHGGDLDAFSQRIRFADREGFPGITLRTGASLITESLQSEPDFVRGRVKDLRYQAAVTVPIRDSRMGAGGCLFLAWKNPPGDLDAIVELTALVSRPIGTAVEMAHARVRLEAFRGSFGPEKARDFAERLRALTGGDTAAVLLSDGQPWLGQSGGADVSPREAGQAPWPSVDDFARCPARCDQRVQILGGREGWPAECLEAGCTAKGRYCVPVVADGAVRAVVTTGFSDRAPVPLCRGLPAALWLAEGLPRREPPTREKVVSVVRPRPDARLQIRCFGGFDITVEGRPVRRPELRREKARELLALLVAAEGRPVPGEHLAERLWPGVGLKAAMGRLHVTIGSLRAAIEPPGGDRWRHVLRDGQRYYLDPEYSVFVDVWRLHDLLRREKSGAAGTRSIERLATDLEEAIALYSGEAFGGEFTGDWTDEIAAGSRHAVLDALARLARIRVRMNDPEGAIATLRRAEEIDPLRQDLQRQLIELLHAVGRNEEAIRSYERLEAALAERLGLPPAQETRRLHRLLRSEHSPGSPLA